MHERELALLRLRTGELTTRWGGSSMADDKEESVEINADETHDGSCSDSDTGDVYTEEKEETPKTFKELVRLLCTAQRGECLLAS